MDRIDACSYSTASDPRAFYLGPIRCSSHTIGQFLDEIRLLLQDRTSRPRSLLFVNAHVYNLARQNDRLRELLNSARINAADGMAIVWAARWRRVPMESRCNMTEAFRAFLLDREMPPSRALLVGCSEREAQLAAQEVNQISKHCRVIKAVSGFLGAEGNEALFRQHPEVDFIFLGMGTPQSEYTAHLASQVSPRAIVWAIGGGTVRIYAGTMTEAPVAWRRLGLQWVHRLCSEPSTLWQRYILGNPLFLWHIVRLGRAGKEARCK